MNLLKRFPGIALLIKICHSITSLVHRNTEEGKSCEGLPILVAGPLDLKSPLSYRQKTCQPSGSFVEMYLWKVHHKKVIVEISLIILSEISPLAVLKWILSTKRFEVFTLTQLHNMYRLF